MHVSSIEFKVFIDEVGARRLVCFFSFFHARALTVLILTLKVLRKDKTDDEQKSYDERHDDYDDPAAGRCSLRHRHTTLSNESCAASFELRGSVEVEKNEGLSFKHTSAS